MLRDINMEQKPAACTRGILVRRSPLSPTYSRGQQRFVELPGLLCLHQAGRHPSFPFSVLGSKSLKSAKELKSSRAIKDWE